MKYNHEIAVLLKSNPRSHLEVLCRLLKVLFQDMLKTQSSTRHNSILDVGVDRVLIGFGRSCVMFHGKSILGVILKRPSAIIHNKTGHHILSCD